MRHGARHSGVVYTSPIPFTLKQRVTLTCASFAIANTLKILLRTCRWDVRDGHYWDEVQAQYGHAILAFWHESSALVNYNYRYRGFHTMTSYSYDGELAARIVRRFGNDAVRGSSSRGGSDGLKELEKVASLAPGIGLTPDGPRGPRREAKLGMAVLAARAGIPIVPHVVVPSRSKRLRSWDRFPIPKPFSRITLVCGKPIFPPPSADDREAVEAMRLQVESELNRLHTELEAELGVDPLLS